MESRTHAGVACGTGKYLLLTEFEGRTVSYRPSFFLLDLWAINRRGKNEDP